MSALIESKSFWRPFSVLGARSAIAALSVVVLMLSLAACSGSSGASTSSTEQQIASAPIATTTSQSTTLVTTTSQATTTSPKKPVKLTPVYTRPMRATLVGENHAPKVNHPWSYSVTVTDASGHSMSGTVDIEFALSGTVVGHDKPPTDPITGNLHHTLKFPAAAVGVPLEVQAIVHTTLGSLTLDWPITVAL
jgi:hypothetical protein